MIATIVPNTQTAFHALRAELLAAPFKLRQAITEVYRRDEAEVVNWLLNQVQPHPELQAGVSDLASHKLVSSVRQQRTRASVWIP